MEECFNHVYGLDFSVDGKAVENVMLLVTSFSMSSLVVGHCWSVEVYPRMDAQIPHA